MVGLQAFLWNTSEFIRSFGFIAGGFIFTAVIVLIVDFGISRVFKRRRNMKPKYITIGILLGVYLGGFAFVKMYGGESGFIAQQLNVHVPWDVQVLNSDHDGAQDSSINDAAVRLTATEVVTLTNELKSRPSWKQGTAIPYALMKFSDNVRSPKLNLPNTARYGLYYSNVSLQHFQDSDQPYRERRVYFLDIKSRILYVYIVDDVNQ